MSIFSITLTNFKGIKGPVKIDLRPITLLFGPNSAGKSTVMQAIHFAREVLERGNANPFATIAGGEAMNLGGFSSLVHGHDPSNVISIRFHFGFAGKGLPEYPHVFPVDSDAYYPFADRLSQSVMDAWVELSVAWSVSRAAPYVCKYSVGLDRTLFAEIECSDDGKKVEIAKLNLLHNCLYLYGDQEKSKEVVRNLAKDGHFWKDEENLLGSFFGPLVRRAELDAEGHDVSRRLALRQVDSALPAWGHRLEIPLFEATRDQAGEPWKWEWAHDEAGHLLTTFITGPGQALRDCLREFRYVGPIRDVPPRNHEPESFLTEDRWAGGIAAWDVLFQSDPDFLVRFNEWLGGTNRLNTGYEVEVKRYKEVDLASPLGVSLASGQLLDADRHAQQFSDLRERRRLLLREQDRNLELAPADVGVGISQVIPVLVAALATKEGLVAIEQPELHIHPALQVVLGDLFIAQTRPLPRPHFLLETHSEHLLLRLLKRIRETTDGEIEPGGAPLTPDDDLAHGSEAQTEDMQLMSAEQLALRRRQFTKGTAAFTLIDEPAPIFGTMV